MSRDLPHLIELAADEVASVGRAAASSINELVHDWGHETRAFVSEHAHSLPAIPLLPSNKRRTSSSLLRFAVPALVIGVVAFLVMKRRRPSSHLPTVEATPATTRPKAEGTPAP